MSIFSHLFSFLKRFRYGSTPNPVRDWLVIFSVSLIVFAGLIVWNIFAFDGIANGTGMRVPSSAPSPVFNRASIDAVHIIFTNRAVEKSKYDTSIYHFVDPSQ